VTTRPETEADDPGGQAERARDSFPRDRFLALVGRLPRYLRLAIGLAGERRLPPVRRAGVLAAAAYLASPIDLIPGVIPVVGQLDDMAVALFALRAALRALDPAVRSEQLAAAGLDGEEIDRDLATLVAVAAWLARRGAAVGRRLMRVAALSAVVAGRAGARAVRRGARPAGQAAARAAGVAAGSAARLARRGLALLRSRGQRERGA
jgi:uncharacterized membrane protein YkvA (DUF1232 family)